LEVVVIQHHHVFVAGNRAGRTWIKGTRGKVGQPGEVNVATGRSDLRNLQWARVCRLRQQRVIGIDYKYRDLREGSNLSRGKIPETARLQLDDAFNTMRTWLE